MFNNFNAELTKLRQSELLAEAERRRSQPKSDSRPVLVTLGKQLVTLGEKLQNTSTPSANPRPNFDLQTDHA